jgi:hypothetical protein
MVSHQKDRPSAVLLAGPLVIIFVNLELSWNLGVPIVLHEAEKWRCRAERWYFTTKNWLIQRLPTPHVVSKRAELV